MSKLLEKIETDKEILSTMPKNNKKNIAKYIQKVLIRRIKSISIILSNIL